MVSVLDFTNGAIEYLLGNLNKSEWASYSVCFVRRRVPRGDGGEGSSGQATMARVAQAALGLSRR